MTRRILHVVGPMDRGGVETWLMHVLRHIDRARYQLTFLARGDRPGIFEEEIRQLGSRVILCPGHPKPWKFARNFVDLLRRHGPFDILHSHLDYFNGLVVRLAAYHGIRSTIAHHHNDLRLAPGERTIARRTYRLLMRRWIRHHARVRVAASPMAAEDMVGPGWANEAANQIMFYGLDFSRFASPPDKHAVRRALRLPDDALVIGHVGRFVTQKNHAFLMEIAREAMALDQRLRLLLVGEGPLRPAIEAQGRELGIADRVHFAGSRDDVPELMLGAMDVFVFPSHHEGLGLVLLEAQAAGLSCVLSDRVPTEVDVVEPLMRRLPLSAPRSTWASEGLDAARCPPLAQAEALSRMTASDFSIDASVAALTRTYDSMA